MKVKAEVKPTNGGGMLIVLTPLEQPNADNEEWRRMVLFSMGKPQASMDILVYPDDAESSMNVFSRINSIEVLPPDTEDP